MAGSGSGYPRWSRSRIALAEAVRAGMGNVAGRYSRGRTRDLLEDASAAVEIALATPRPGHGDLVAGRLRRDPRGFVLEDVAVFAAGRELTPGERRLGAIRAGLEARAAVLRAVRGHLAAQGFLEVETPARVLNPGLEPHLRPFPAGIDPDGRPRWLITSPELHLKRLLAAGYERVFEIARAFRDDERGAQHISEFALLEWYRAWAGLDDLAGDVAALLPLAARACGRDPARAVEGCDLAATPECATYADLFRRHAGRDPWSLDVDERERCFVAEVEPRLGSGAPLLVSEYPPDTAALARLVAPSAPGGWTRVAARIELYVAGVELANGFDELNDPAEQRRRHQTDRETRLTMGTAAPPLDEAFLAALEAGMPPAAGMALGLDRLVMVVTGSRSLADVRAFVD